MAAYELVTDRKNDFVRFSPLEFSASFFHRRDKRQLLPLVREDSVVGCSFRGWVILVEQTLLASHYLPT